MEPQTTKVPAEKKLIKSERPLIHHGRAPPAAKKDFMFLPDLEKLKPHIKTNRVKTTITAMSKLCIIYLHIRLTSSRCNAGYYQSVKNPVSKISSVELINELIEVQLQVFPLYFMELL